MRSCVDTDIDPNDLKGGTIQKKTQFLLKMSPFFSHLISPLKAFV